MIAALAAWALRMAADDQLPPAAPAAGGLESRWVLYFTAAAAILVIVLSSGERLNGFFGRLRRAASERDDADIAELRRTVTNLSERLDEFYRLGQEHAAWDRQVYQRLVARGEDIDPPPPLF